MGKREAAKIEEKNTQRVYLLGLHETTVAKQGAHVGVGYRNLPYAGQDKNAAIEGYHSFMKSILKSERSRMVGRRVD